MKQPRFRFQRAMVIAMLLSICSLTAFSQDRKITGTVIDEAGNLPLPGVSISVKGSTSGTQSGADGKYSIDVPAGAKTLVFSFTGFAPQEKTIGSDSVINVT
ncbi:MAG: carboxypeptidase-like regulatory domain-containing protein, partial [Flavitalea sp.]